MFILSSIKDNMAKRDFMESLLMAALFDVEIREMDMLPEDEKIHAACVKIKWSWEDDGSELTRYVFVTKDGTVKWSVLNDISTAKDAPDWFIKQIEESANEFEANSGA